MGKPKQRVGYSKKRRFKGNQFVDKNRQKLGDCAVQISLTSSASVDIASSSPVAWPNARELPSDSSFERSADFTTSASYSKIQSIAVDCSTPKTEVKPMDGYRLIDMRILSELIECLLCPECKSPCIQIYENLAAKKGLASSVVLTCQCDFQRSFYTSKRAGKGFEVNRRMVYAMRACGNGYSGIEKFTTLMNMPPPMTANNYDKIATNVMFAAKAVAEKTMKDAANELKRDIGANEDMIVDTGVSCDGTWQRRGYSSLNGVTTIISMENGKVLDVEPMVRTCKACKLHEKLKESAPLEYDMWKASHRCPMDYTGSAPSMECVGAKRIFQRSLERNGLRYTEFYGDGDSKSYSTVKEIYPGITVKKFECVGHIQKRVGTRLRKLKQANKGLGGKGKLTVSIIDRLQNYYGLAIRQNVGKKDEMTKAIHASLFHVASSEKNNWHSHCPEGNDSWCAFKRDKVNGTATYKPGPGLPVDIVTKIKPIYNELSCSELIEKCLHGKTQNQNESFNGMIWERVPKSIYVGHTQLKFGVYDAIANFIIGRHATLLMYELLKIEPGKYTKRGCAARNKKRLLFAGYQSQAKSKSIRKLIRGQKKRKQDREEDKEGRCYGAGEF